MLKRTISILLVSFFVACAASSKFAPTVEEMPVMQSKLPGLTYEDAMQGYKLYTTHCSNCHRLHNPKEYTAEKWNKILPEMFEKSKLSDTAQQQSIRNYLAAKSKTNPQHTTGQTMDKGR
jgi:cytochrome c5